MTAPENFGYRGVDGKVKKVSIEIPAALGPKEVLIKITHSSLCGTDLHYVPYGMALGHEGVGLIEKIGSGVTTLKVGDRVGAGYLRDSCGHCSYCLNGKDIYCYERNIYGDKDFNTGTFGDYYVGVETYIYKIPENMSSVDAAPLQCAGGTVYSALISSTYPGCRVGVLGIGGLGHLAIQFASKMGFETAVFSTSADKEAEAKSFGAKEFYLLSEPEKVIKPIDVLIVTSGKYPDWEKLMVKNVLARNADIVALSAPTGPITLPSTPFFFESYNLKSSLVASRHVHTDMLNFAAAHGIKPATEVFEFSEKGLQEAVDKLNAGKIRYRGVLVRE